MIHVDLPTNLDQRSSFFDWRVLSASLHRLHLRISIWACHLYGFSEHGGFSQQLFGLSVGVICHWTLHCRNLNHHYWSRLRHQSLSSLNFRHRNHGEKSRDAAASWPITFSLKRLVVYWPDVLSPLPEADATHFTTLAYAVVWFWTLHLLPPSAFLAKSAACPCPSF